MPRYKSRPKVFSHRNFSAKNSRGQVADTATWIIATIVIIFVLMISVYAASKIGRTSVISGLFNDDKNQEILVEQSFHAYLLTKNSNGVAFYNQISSSGKIDSTDKLIAAALFGKIYGVPSSEISLKITDKKENSAANLDAQAVNMDGNNFIEIAIKLESREKAI